MADGPHEEIRVYVRVRGQTRWYAEPMSSRERAREIAKDEQRDYPNAEVLVQVRTVTPWETIDS